MSESKHKAPPKPTPDQIEAERDKIVRKFYQSMFGRRSEQRGSHDGKAGYLAEKAMGLSHNNEARPDFGLIELKTGKSKTTFGDWSPDYKIWESASHNIDRDRFMKIFGKYNEKKSRWSWSGSAVPKVNTHNLSGQILEVEDDLSIVIKYSYSKDQRQEKANIVPPNLQKENITLARWSSTKLRSLVENKFNMGGWCKCKEDKNGVCSEIVFGPPFTYEEWVGWVKSGIVFFDSGMHQGSQKPYSHWRAKNSHWESLKTKSYDHRHQSEYSTVNPLEQVEDSLVESSYSEIERNSRSSSMTLGEMMDSMSHNPKNRERKLAAFGEVIINRIPQKVWEGLSESEVKASIHAVLAGYKCQSFEIAPFPLKGSSKEKGRWFDSIPLSSIFKEQCAPHRLCASALGVIKVAKILEVEAVRDGSSGSRYETAATLLSLEGQPLNHAITSISRSIGCHEPKVLLENMIVLGVLPKSPVTETLCLQDTDQMERLLGAMSLTAESRYKRLIPSTDLIMVLGGKADLSHLVKTTVATILESGVFDRIKDTPHKDEIIAGLPVALGLRNTCESYPLAASESERSSWRESIKNDSRIEFYSPWTSSVGRRFSTVPKSSVLRAAIAMDELWKSEDSPIRCALEAYAIAVQNQAKPNVNPKSEVFARNLQRQNLVATVSGKPRQSLPASLAA